MNWWKGTQKAGCTMWEYKLPFFYVDNIVITIMYS